MENITLITYTVLSVRPLELVVMNSVGPNFVTGLQSTI